MPNVPTNLARSASFASRFAEPPRSPARHRGCRTMRTRSGAGKLGLETAGASHPRLLAEPDPRPRTRSGANAHGPTRARQRRGGGRERCSSFRLDAIVSADFDEALAQGVTDDAVRACAIASKEQHPRPNSGQFRGPEQARRQRRAGTRQRCARASVLGVDGARVRGAPLARAPSTPAVWFRQSRGVGSGGEPGVSAPPRGRLTSPRSMCSGRPAACRCEVRSAVVNQRIAHCDSRSHF